MGKINLNGADQNLRAASQPLAFALRLFCFWLCFFAAFRLWFVLWLAKDWAEEAPWAAFWKALPLDLSMAGYLAGPAVLLWFALAASNRKDLLRKILRWYHAALLLILVFLFGANVFIYEEWHTLLNNRALDYFRTPAAMLDSMSLIFKIGSVLTYVGVVGLWFWMYKTGIEKKIQGNHSRLGQLSWAPVLLPLIVLAIRGGWGKVPINESAAYYSAYPFNNHAATNAAWHLLHSMIETRSTDNHFRSMDDVEARRLTRELFSSDSSAGAQTGSWLLSTPGVQPNIVFILMESMTAQVVQELGGAPGVCPNLSRLIQTGILFEQCYSSGYRTDQGLVAVLGGFPAQPDQSVVLLQDKAEKLPSIPKVLKNNGYRTAFFYGGQLTFANIGVWLRNQRFEQVFSEADFTNAERSQRWGADDTKVFDKALSTFSQTQQPFFGSILTLSLHTPYDVPFESRWSGPSEQEKFLNSAAFADHAIGRFFEQAARQSWFANTLFVLVADHGHQQPGGIRMDQPRSRQVPLIFTGPLIDPAWQGKRINTLGNHHDIPATLLPALGFSAGEFGWSKNLLEKSTRDFAYFSNENGLGWMAGAGSGFFPFSKKAWQAQAGPGLDSLQQRQARAYLQTLYNDFLAL